MFVEQRRPSRVHQAWRCHPLPRTADQRMFHDQDSQRTPPV